MKDTVTKQRLFVSTKGTVGPYITVPFAQLDGLCAVLDNHRMRYTVDENAISLNGEPETIVVNLGRGGDANAVQKILDGIG